MVSINSKSSIIEFSSPILKFGKKGEKTGWTHIEVSPKQALQLFPGNKKSFRVKGFLDNQPISGIALLPMGKGFFILPLNISLRKALNKKEGDRVHVQLQVDFKKLQINKDLMQCLKEEPRAFSYFNELPKSHQNYFSKWIDTAKTDSTKAKRIARTLDALSQKMNYAQMMRAGI